MWRNMDLEPTYESIKKIGEEMRQTSGQPVGPKVQNILPSLAFFLS
jgi:hypothetical protein